MESGFWVGRGGSSGWCTTDGSPLALPGAACVPGESSGCPDCCGGRSLQATNATARISETFNHDCFMSSAPRIGVPPLAGLCTLQEAARVGYSVDESVARLLRCHWIEMRLAEICAARIPATPEWE